MKYVARPLTRTADASRGRLGWRPALRIAAVVAGVLVAVYFAVGLLADLAARHIPEAWEGKLAAAPREAQAGAPELERPRRILAQLLAHGGLRPLEYRVFLIDHASPNALALPGGAIGVTRGLLEDVPGETGLALVLAHELGHHQERHALQRLGRMLLWNVLRALVFGDSGSAAPELLLQIAESGYSRDQEREADAFGLRLVHAAYGHLDGALEFFEKIEARDGEGLPQWGAFLRTHPLTSERLDSLRELRAWLLDPPRR